MSQPSDKIKSTEIAAAIIANAKRLYHRAPDTSAESANLIKALEMMDKVILGQVVDDSIISYYKKHGIPLKPENLLGAKQRHCVPWVGDFTNFKGNSQEEYYVSFTAAEKPIIAKAGKGKGKWIWGYYRERYINERVWLERISEIEDHFFPDILTAKAMQASVEACKQLTISIDLLRNLTLVFGPGGYCSNSELGTDWGNDADLPLRMFDWCRKNNAPLKKGTESIPWLEALAKWIKAAEVGDDYHKKASKHTVEARESFRHLTGAVFAGYQVNQVGVSNFMQWVKGRAPQLKGFILRRLYKMEKL